MAYHGAGALAAPPPKTKSIQISFFQNPYQSPPFKYQQAGQLMGRSLQQSSSYVAPCDPSTQRMALMMLYNNTLGGAWANRSGWLDLSPAQMATPASLTLALAAVPLSSGTCASPNGSSVLPDHCCWYGVGCCSLQTCVNAVPSSCTSCFCKPGLVISLVLSANVVGRLLPPCLSASSIRYRYTTYRL